VTLVANETMLSMIAESEKFAPPASYVRKSYVQSWDEYLTKYRQSVKDPEGFWSDIADELQWQQRKATVVTGKMPDFAFFPGSTINVCENCVDRYANNPATKNKVAIFFDSENGDSKALTYGQLHREVQKFANVLLSLGLQKGDVVSVYMQNLAETYVVLLA
jgi:acetyl-CoA synthetase